MKTIPSEERGREKNWSSLLHAEHYGEVEEVPPRAPWNEIGDQCIYQCKIHESMI